MFQEPHNTYTVGVRLYRPSRVDTHVAARRDRSQLYDPQRSCHVSVMTRRFQLYAVDKNMACSTSTAQTDVNRCIL